MDVVDRQRLGDQLGLEVPALREQRPHRAVDHPRGQGRLLARSRLAAEERAGDLAGRVVLLLDVDRQRQEVDVAQVAHRRGAEDHRVPGAHDDGSARLAGELAGLEGDLLAADLSRDAAHVKHAHVFAFPFGRPVGGPISLRTLVLVTACDVSEAANVRESARRRRRRAALRPANAVGVPVTPARIPPSKSRRTRAATAAERRSRSKRSRSSPSARARSHRCGSSMLAVVGVDRVDHRPERVLALARRRLGGRVQGRRARALGGEREVAHARGAAAARGSAPRRPRSAGRRGRGRRSPPARRRGRGRRGRSAGTAALVSSRHAGACS